MVQVSRERVLLQAARRGLDQTRLAERMGVSLATLSLALSRGSMRASTFRKLCQALAETPEIQGADLVLEKEPVPWQGTGSVTTT